MSDITIFSWTSAKFRPKHSRGPRPNGTYACGYLQAFDTPSTNLSGLNLFTSGPQMSGSRWRVGIRVHMQTFFGTVMLPIFVSSSASLETNAAGGYRRRASWITIVTCWQMECELSEESLLHASNLSNPEILPFSTGLGTQRPECWRHPYKPVRLPPWHVSATQDGGRAALGTRRRPQKWPHGLQNRCSCSCRRWTAALRSPCQGPARYEQLPPLSSASDPSRCTGVHALLSSSISASQFPSPSFSLLLTYLLAETYRRNNIHPHAA